MKRLVRRYRGILLIALAYVILLYAIPSTGYRMLDTSSRYFWEMLTILPPVAILMGLFQVWVPRAFIEKYMGTRSGVAGVGISLALGTAPTGPLYIAFPIAASLLSKGARISNIVIFLGAWATIKLPQLMVEVKFLGLAFSLWRLVFTVLSLMVMGWLMERLMKAELPHHGDETPAAT